VRKKLGSKSEDEKTAGLEKMRLAGAKREPYADRSAEMTVGRAERPGEAGAHLTGIQAEPSHTKKPLSSTPVKKQKYVGRSP